MTSADPCTGARKAGHRSGADSPRGIDHGQFDGARAPPRWSGPQGAIGRSRRIGSVLEGYAALGRRPRVTLRFATLHFARPAAGIQEPHERGTGAVLWSRSWGWRILPGMPALNHCPGYINVERAANQQPRHPRGNRCSSSDLRITHRPAISSPRRNREQRAARSRFHPCFPVHRR